MHPLSISRNKFFESKIKKNVKTAEKITEVAGNCRVARERLAGEWLREFGRSDWSLKRRGRGEWPKSVGNYVWRHRVRHQWVSEPRPPWEADSTRLDAKSEENSTNFSKILIFSKTHRFIRDKRRSDGLEFWQMSFFQKLFGGSKQKKRTYDNIKDRIFQNFRQVEYFMDFKIYLSIQKWL